MEKDIQIIFFDIDGTLLNPQTAAISPKTQETLVRLRQKGIRLFIATGRPPVCVPELTGVEFDGYITMNGSLCYTSDSILFHNPLSRSDVEKVIENAQTLGRPVSLVGRDWLAANGWDEDLAAYYRFSKKELTVAEDFDEYRKGNIYQIMLGCRAEDHEAIVQGTDGVTVTYSCDFAADVISTKSGKAEAIRKILEYYQLDVSQSMAFGDGYNDIEMLKTVGTGVAMGNADSRVKEIAKEQCRSVYEEGIYHYCVEKGLI